MRSLVRPLAYLATCIMCLILLITCIKVEKKVMVSTGSVSNVAKNSATAEGTIVDIGEGITDHGHVYSTSSDVTMSGTKVALGSKGSTGTFISELSNLTAGTTYYIKAYVIGNGGTRLGKEISFKTADPVVPVMTTTAVTAITTTTATSGGDITADGGAAVTARGICWSTSTGPDVNGNKTTDGAGTGIFISNLSGLADGSEYYVRAYATNAAGTGYGNEISFSTVTIVLPTVTTTAASSISSTYAQGGGSVTSDGGSPILAKGVCWSKNPNPTTSDPKTDDGTGTGGFGNSMGPMEPATLYHVRAYATNLKGTAYGEDLTFTTLAGLPVVVTVEVTGITGTGATSGGNITNDGGAAIINRGVCWNTTGSPSPDGLKTADGNGTGLFSSALTGLTTNTKYYVRAYAQNSIGLSFGEELTFTTLGITTATLTTAAITSILKTTAAGGGNITNDGGSAITARGICWSLNQSPTLSDSHTTDDFGSGVFSSQLTSLSPGKTYYVRAYATNASGTTYGPQVSFITAPDVPKVTTAAPVTVTSTTADPGGEVTDDNGSTVTTRGICYNTVGSPTTSDSKKDEALGKGTFTMALTGLTPSTTYYARAFAVNGVGTAYGAQVQVVTPADIPTLTTNAITAVTTTTATSGGVIASDNGSTILVKGICWSTSPAPVIGGSNQTTDGGSSTPFTSAITGLLPGTKYYVRAYATNGKGTAYGDEQTFTTNSVSATVPGAPTGVSAVAGNALATVTFTAPASDGGSAITGYTATSNPSGFTGNGSASPITVTGLINGTAYTFTVTATNSIGTGPASSASNSITPSTSLTVPGAPTGVSATGGYEKATVTFIAPVNNGGSSITGYTVTSNPGGFTGTGSASPVTVNGLPALISYTFTVTATNAIGEGPASSASNSVTPTTVPGSPTIGTATKGNAQASVSFTAPVSDGGSAIISYTITSNPGSKTGTSTVSPITVTGLTNGTAYTFTVAATNANGTGSASTASNSITPSTVPGAPTIGTATKGDAQASVTFTAPVSDGGSAITGYIATSNPGSKTGTGITSPVTVADLTNGAAYTFTVVATNINGNSTPSSASNLVTPSTVPDAPTIGTATAGDGQATVTFAPSASDGGSSITGYTVTSSPGGLTGTGSVSPVTVAGLTNLTAYTFTVVATNLNGNSSPSASSNSAIPGTVINLSTGKIWMDRNLGASQVATSSTDAASYGDLYQWGRLSDGHQIRTSSTTTTKSTTDTPGHGNFILATTSPYDWRSPQNNNLWQGASGVNNTCPTGFRIPTEAEFDAERASWISQDAAGAYNSVLKLPLVGLRLEDTGLLNGVGSSGRYWTSTIDGLNSRRISFDSGSASFASSRRSTGFAVRCIKD